MTDTTITLNSGSGGASLAGDTDVTTGFHQYIKLKFGASGTQTTVTSSVGLPVNIVQDSLAGGADGERPILLFTYAAAGGATGNPSLLLTGVGG